MPFGGEKTRAFRQERRGAAAVFCARDTATIGDYSFSIICNSSALSASRSTAAAVRPLGQRGNTNRRNCTSEGAADATEPERGSEREVSNKHIIRTERRAVRVLLLLGQLCLATIMVDDEGAMQVQSGRAPGLFYKGMIPPSTPTTDILQTGERPESGMLHKQSSRLETAHITRPWKIAIGKLRKHGVIVSKSRAT
ncbi:hypothetical protein J6590_048570 [Homalodisca vitripennis]|nr:hypothetical protein J6590_048570 [Homalodisca vitripennis]